MKASLYKSNALIAFSIKAQSDLTIITSVFQRRVKQCRRPQTPCRTSRWRPTVRSPPQTPQQNPQTPLLLTTEEHLTVSTHLLQNTSIHHRQRADWQWDWKPDKDWSSRRQEPIFIIKQRLSTDMWRRFVPQLSSFCHFYILIFFRW